MSNRALVIRTVTVGDPKMCDAIVDGIDTRVIPLATEELETVKAECERLRAENESLKALPAARLPDPAIEDMAIKYAPKQHGAVYLMILLTWAMLWMCIYSIYDYLAAWNRGELDD